MPSVCQACLAARAVYYYYITGLIFPWDVISALPSEPFKSCPVFRFLFSPSDLFFFLSFYFPDTIPHWVCALFPFLLLLCVCPSFPPSFFLSFSLSPSFSLSFFLPGCLLVVWLSRRMQVCVFKFRANCMLALKWRSPLLCPQTSNRI